MRISFPFGGGLPPWRRGFPFFVGTPRSGIERLRAAGAREVWTRGPIWKRLALGVAMTVGWPLSTFGDAMRISIRRSKEGHASLLRTFGTLYGAALTHNIPPNLFAFFELELGVSSDELSDFLLPVDMRMLHSFSLRQGANLDDVQNKASFERICTAHGLPCVKSLAVFHEGLSRGEDVVRSWTAPMFVKALTGFKGAGAELWRPGGRGFVSSNGDDLSIDELIEALRTGNCIIQPVLEDHPCLRAFGTVALSSVRVMTGKAHNGPSSPIGAALSLAVEPSSLTSRFGVGCGINIDDGTVCRTTPIEDDDRLLNRNLLGFALPHWEDCLHLVCKAHDEAFPQFATLGWDLALTSSGPVLLETNVNWGMVGHQWLNGPLGKTALADVIDELLAPAPADRSAASLRSTRAARSPSPAPPTDRGRAGAKGRRRRPPAAKA